MSSFVRELFDSQVLGALMWVDTRDMGSDGLTRGVVPRYLLHVIMSGRMSMHHARELWTRKLYKQQQQAGNRRGRALAAAQHSRAAPSGAERREEDDDVKDSSLFVFPAISLCIPEPLAQTERTRAACRSARLSLATTPAQATWLVHLSSTAGPNRPSRWGSREGR